MLDLSSGRLRGLCRYTGSGGEPETPGWRFNRRTLAAGTAALVGAPPGDLMIVDELGPTEIVAGKGWAVALDLVRSGRHGTMVAVVRPALVPGLRGLLPNVPIEVLIAGSDECDARLESLLTTLQGQQ
jgi:hypothetical protein